jgi:SAM-dependent methyltransferase
MKNASLLVVLGFALAMTVGLPAQDHDQAQGAHGAAAQKPDHMDHSFADVERYAKSFDDPSRDAWQMPDRVIAALGLKSGQTVADIGAGTGYFTVRLAKSAAAPKVFAVDIEAGMVEYIQQRAMREGLKNLVAVKASADRTNLPEPVDVVLIVDTYHRRPGSRSSVSTTSCRGRCFSSTQHADSETSVERSRSAFYSTGAALNLRGWLPYE